MKILHLVCDGYHPKNERKIFTNLRDILPEDKYPALTEIDSVDKKRRYIQSRDSWMRIYSKREPWQHKAEGKFDAEAYGRPVCKTSTYSYAHPDTLIWNKLADAGVYSYIFPFYLFEHSALSNVLGFNESSNKRIEGHILPYNTYRHYVIKDGTVEKTYDMPLKYSVFNEYFDKIHESTDEICKEFGDKWFTPEVHQEYMPQLVDLLRTRAVNPILERLAPNKELLTHLINPAIDRTLANGGKDAYIHIGLGESDCILHFFKAYPEAEEILRKEYFDYLVKMWVDQVDADVVIVTGDHGMGPYFIKSDTHTEFDLDDRSLHAIKSGHGISILYGFHSNTIGAMVFAKEGYEFFNEDLVKKNETAVLASDAIHDAIIDNILKK